MRITTFYKFILLCIGLIIFGEVTKWSLNLDRLLQNSLAEKLTTEQIKNYFDYQDKWKWVSYIFTPIYILLKTSIIASVLYIGTFFFSRAKVTFKQLWGIVVTAEFLFLLIPLFKIVWFYIFQTNYNLQDIQYFMPLSALNIIGYQGLEAWYIYPLQTLNLFEFVYWLLLAYYLGNIIQTNTDNGLKIVAFSYVPALILWVVCVMFFILNNS
jgi:hypothetical protein